MKNWIKKSALLAATLALPIVAVAEDIDLFLGPPPADADAPNVLFLIDNTANWNTPFQEEMDALIAVFDGLLDVDINVGIMMFTETGNPNSNVDGGYVRAHVRSMNETNVTAYQQLLASFDVGDDKSNGGKAGLTFAEAYRYFDGGVARSGTSKVKTDYHLNDSGIVSVTTGNGSNRVTTEVRNASQTVYDLEGHALGSFDDEEQLYISPIAEDSCGKNYVIYISNGAVQDNNSDTSTATGLLTGEGGNTNQISISPSGSADNVADEWARFMRRSEHEITTFTVDVNKITNGQGPGWTALLKSVARVSDGEYYDVETGGGPQDLVDAINDALSRILAVNSVFASVALPASSNAQSTFLNQVFVGMFRPDESGKARWMGNLKQYKIGVYDGALRALDADSNPAINAGTGFVAECARSFWTPTTADSYWENLTPRGECRAADNLDISNSPDGPVVEKGAQAYTLRSSTNRNVLTCTSCDSSSLIAFNTTNITPSMVGVDNNDDRDALVNWSRGLDLMDEDGDGVTSAEMRASVHESVIHSRPVALNYGTDESPEVVVYYGGNDGMLRAINGNRTTAHSSVDAGHEFWSFMPPEFFGNIARLRDNDVPIKFPASGTSAPDTGETKPYGMDGPISGFEGPLDGAQKKYLFVGMRRGGRAQYAFDVTSQTSPSLLWRRGCDSLTDDDVCTTDVGAFVDEWQKLGQTWSAATVTFQEGYVDDDANLKPILIMGGGYDDCEDYDGDVIDGLNHACSSTKGNVVYVLDAQTGAILKTFDAERSVVGKVTVVPVSKTDRTIEYAYFVDTGGNVYRIAGGTLSEPEAIADTAPRDWEIAKIAALGCSTAVCEPAEGEELAANRKFLFGPDVIRIPEQDGKIGVIVGTGDREKPVIEYGAAADVQNYFFSIVDEPTSLVERTNADGDTLTAICGSDIICLDALSEVTLDGFAEDEEDFSPNGWYMALRAKEQVVTGALTLDNRVNFSTHIPAQLAEGACESNLGVATGYSVHYANGAGYRSTFTGGGLPPTPVGGIVRVENSSGGDDEEEDGEDGEGGEGRVNYTDYAVCISCAKPPGSDDDGGGGDDGDGGGSDEEGGSSIEVIEVGSGITWTQPLSRVYWNIKQ